jgi:hypothetical protein
MAGLGQERRLCDAVGAGSTRRSGRAFPLRLGRCSRLGLGAPASCWISGQHPTTNDGDRRAVPALEVGGDCGPSQPLLQQLAVGQRERLAVDGDPAQLSVILTSWPWLPGPNATSVGSAMLQFDTYTPSDVTPTLPGKTKRRARPRRPRPRPLSDIGAILGSPDDWPNRGRLKSLRYCC